MADLGKLERVDVRKVWTHEAHDFTPWLADHIDELGELLGFELEVVQREHAIGDFSLDILARDLGRDCLVAIENQLEATDHSHLGQLLTYAAGTEARTAVWVVPEFREEHRQALDWLNRGLEGSVEFFGVVVELLKVDDSKPAINMRLVAAPNNWSKVKRSEVTGEVTSKMAAYQNFFQVLIDELRDKHKFTNAKAGQPQNWFNFASGTGGFTYGVSFTNDGRVRAEVFVDLKDREANVAALTRLRDLRADIEREIGEPLEWDSLEGRRGCRIAAHRPGRIDDPADQLEEYRRWAVDRLLNLKKVFGPRLREVGNGAGQ
ncbi:MAG: DUF4268 domain-containing protein [Polyangiaceae bacterium]